MMRVKWWLAIGAAISLAAGMVYGAGFQLYTEGSAEALGQAGAISGRTNLVSLAWYNPSALAGAECSQVMVGSAFISIRTGFNGTFGNSSMSDEWRTVPHFYYVQPLNENLTAMLSVNAPYGLITEWPEVWAGSALATYSELRAMYLTPSIAGRVNDQFSVSIGVNVVDADAQLEGTGRVVKGDDLGYGGTFSAHYQAAEAWSIGGRYQSRVKLEIEGEINGVQPAKADLALPSTVNMGVANTSINNLSLGLDVVWTEWSTYDQLAITGLPVSPKNWEDVWSIRLGGEYALGDSWSLRIGYVWDESPVPDTTRSPELPGSDRQMIMAGVGWKEGRVGVDLAYAYIWADKAKTGSEVTAVIPTSAGEYETSTHLIALSVSYTF